MFAEDNQALNDCLTRLSYGAPHGLRDFMANQLAESVRTQYGAAAGGNLDDVAPVVERLRSDGLVELGRVLDDRQVAAVHDALAAAPVYDCHKVEPGVPPQPLAALRGRVHYASYAPAALIGAPHLLELANDPRLLRIVESYLGCPPTLYSVNAWWSFAQDVRAQWSQAFHRDRDDFRFVTMFVYLTPVAAQTGPHRYVQGSHDPRLFAERLARIGATPAGVQTVIEPLFQGGTVYEYAEQSAQLFGPLVHTWEGAAGTAILADTYGLHMGNPLVAGERLMFWARYGLGPNMGSLTRDEVDGGIDVGTRIGRDARARYINRLITGDPTILAEIAPGPRPIERLAL